MNVNLVLLQVQLFLWMADLWHIPVYNFHSILHKIAELNSESNVESEAWDT